MVGPTGRERQAPTDAELQPLRGERPMDSTVEGQQGSYEGIAIGRAIPGISLHRGEWSEAYSVSG